MRWLALSVALVVLSAPVGARADETASQQDQARRLGREGIDLYDQGRWGEAFDKLAEAERLHHAPTLVLYMARSARNQGKLVHAAELYQALVNEDLGTDAPAQFVDAKDTAFRELEVVRQQTPSLLIASPPADLTLDGAPLTAEQQQKLAGNQALPVDPGEHVIAAGGRTKTVRLEKGSGITRVDLSTSEDAPPPNDETDPGTGLVIPTVIAFALGAAGLGLGIGAGVTATGKADDLKSRCLDGRCFAEDEALADDATLFAHLSTAGFVTAGVGIAAGVILIAVSVSSDDGDVAVALTPTRLSVEVRF